MNKQQEVLINRINELCKQRDYSYYMLSYKSGVPISTLLHILDGSSKNPGFFTIMKLCDGLNITPSKFLNTIEFENLRKE